MYWLYKFKYQALDINVPKKNISFINDNRCRDPWITKQLKKLTNKKARSYIKFKQTEDPVWHENYVCLRSIVNKEYRSALNRCFKLLQDSIRSNSSYLWYNLNRNKRNIGINIGSTENTYYNQITEAFKDPFFHNFTKNSAKYKVDTTYNPNSNSIGCYYS